MEEEPAERMARELGLADLRARLVPNQNKPGENGGGDAVRLLVRPEQLFLAQGLEKRLRQRAEHIGFIHFSLGERT